MPLTLLVPDLLPPADAPAEMREVRLPALEKALGRSEVARARSDGAYGWLAAEFGLAAPVPFAAIALAGEQEPREGAWLRADPVHLRIERDLVALHDASILEVEPAEAEALVAALQDFFRDDGLEFVAASPSRWYVRVPETAVPQTTPLHAAVGRDIFTLLPRGGAPLNWRSMITEAQMVMSAHEVNAHRESTGRPAINSVWFWGEGVLPAAVDPRHGEIHADDPFARGLGRLSSARVHPKPADFAALTAPQAATEVLVVIDDFTAPLRASDLPAWLAAAKAFDERWAKPAATAAAVKAWGTVRFVLSGESAATVATLTPRSRWRLLAKPQRLRDHA